MSDRALREHVPRDGRWWTQGGSNRYLHGEESIVAVSNYVERQSHCMVWIAENAIVDEEADLNKRRG